MSETDCDVLVVGGGVTGVGAALSAARAGARTTLIESRPFVGGNATTGLAIHSFFTRHREQVVRGIAQELVGACQAAGGRGRARSVRRLRQHGDTGGWRHIPDGGQSPPA